MDYDYRPKGDEPRHLGILLFLWAFVCLPLFIVFSIPIYDLLDLPRRADFNIGGIVWLGLSAWFIYLGTRHKRARGSELNPRTDRTMPAERSIPLERYREQRDRLLLVLALVAAVVIYGLWLRWVGYD
jgi:hypothetical protein